MGNDGRRYEEERRYEIWENAIEAINLLFDEDERKEQEEKELYEEAKMRMVYDETKNVMNMAKKRATDCKGNACVFFPKKVGYFDFESRLDMYRLEAMGIFMDYVEENCNGKDNNEVTFQNLTKMA